MRLECFKEKTAKIMVKKKRSRKVVRTFMNTLRFVLLFLLTFRGFAASSKQKQLHLLSTVGEPSDGEIH